MTDINRGYYEYIVGLGKQADDPAPRESRSRLETMLRAPYEFARDRKVLAQLVTWTGAFKRLLGLYKAAKGEPKSEMYAAVRKNLRAFNKQYPFHFYPLLAKSYELAYLTSKLASVGNAKVLELAIGEGSLSSKAFIDRAGITALDMNPYSIGQTRNMPHIAERVIADCIVPPVRDGSYKLLISNNFLHHVTEKEQVLERWSRISETVLFNENTPGWSSCFHAPLRLRAAGRESDALSADRAIQRHSLQFLLEETQVDELVNKYFDVTEKFSFLDRSTYALATFFSHLMGIFGPPTPPWLKRITNGAGGEYLLSMSLDLAELMLLYDFHQNRADDVFVFYSAKSKRFKQQPGKAFGCPNCSAALAYGENCQKCGTDYPILGGMWFLLPSEFQGITQTFRPSVIEALDPEHL